MQTKHYVEFKMKLILPCKKQLILIKGTLNVKLKIFKIKGDNFQN